MKLLKTLLLSAAALIATSVAQAQYSLLLSRSTGQFGYGYGGSAWTQFTSLLDSTAAANSFTISTVTDVSNASAVSAADALFIDQRWTSGTFSASELTNLSAFIASGKRVVFIGENDNWLTWNNQFLSLVGDSFAGYASSPATAIGSSPLVAGVGSISLAGAGASVGTTGTALFDSNFSRLYGPASNVLTILDVNLFSNSYIGDIGNARFASNVATWIGTAPEVAPATPVPEPSTYGLMGAGALGAFAFLRRRRAAKKAV